MPFQRGIHAVIQLRQLARIAAEQMRPQLPQPGAHTLRVGGQIEWPQRAHLSIAHQVIVRFHRHDRAVKNGHGFPAGPFVGGLMQGKLDAIGEDAGDFHAGTRNWADASSR